MGLKLQPPVRPICPGRATHRLLWRLTHLVYYRIKWPLLMRRYSCSWISIDDVGVLTTRDQFIELFCEPSVYVTVSACVPFPAASNLERCSTIFPKNRAMSSLSPEVNRQGATKICDLEPWSSSSSAQLKNQSRRRFLRALLSYIHLEYHTVSKLRSHLELQFTSAPFGHLFSCSLIYIDEAF